MKCVVDTPTMLKKEADMVAEGLLNSVYNGELKVTDNPFLAFMPCLFKEGNIDYLRVIAEECFEKEENIEKINVFLDYVEVMIHKGERLLQRSKNGSNSKKRSNKTD